MSKHSLVLFGALVFGNPSLDANTWAFKENKKVPESSDSETIRATLTVVSMHTGTVLCYLAKDEAGVTNTI